MKSLKPSHREKKRYLLINGKDANKKDIEETILEFIGVLGYAETSPKFLNTDSNGIVLAVNRKSVDRIRASFLMSEKDIRIEKVSGNIGKIE